MADLVAGIHSRSRHFLAILLRKPRLKTPILPNFQRTTLEQRRMRSAEDHSTLKIILVLKVLRTLKTGVCNAEIECTGKHAQPGASQETGKKPPAPARAAGSGQDHQ
jgi:hypothetical protein